MILKISGKLLEKMWVSLAVFFFFSSKTLFAFHKVKFYDAQSGETIEVAEGELIVHFKPKKTIQSKRKKLLESADADETEQIVFDEAGDKVARRIKIRHTKFGEEQCLSKKKCLKMSHVIEKLKADPDVEAVEPNVIRKHFFSPNDPLYTTGATEEYNGVSKFQKQWSVDKTSLPQAWDITTGKSTVLIGICDDGIDSAHEELAGKIVKQYDFYSGDSNAAHLSGDVGHGTHVAGIAAAIKNNSKGIAGVSDSNLLIAKVLGPDGGTDTAVANGIKWCVDNGAKVINLSLGGPGKTLTLENAINYAYSKGAVVVAAAGNEALSGNPVSYPAAYNNVIAVAATDKNDVRGSFSNYGSYVDIAAPGVEILSTIPKSLSSANTGDTNGSGYTGWDGTSMATPFVSGVVSLLFAVKPALTFAEIENVLYTTARDLGSAGKDVYYGWGRIQPLQALQSIAASSAPTAGNVLISQFATRGGVSASDEFVELYNPTANSISLAGWQLQYLSATGTSWSTRLTFPSTASIAAGGYYLTANPAGYSSPNSGPVPNSNWNSTSGIADDGHIRIVDSTGKEIDRVGYGSAAQPEGGTPGAPNHGTSANTKSVGRTTDGTDTDVNRNDFSVRAQRNPKSSGGSPPPASTTANHIVISQMTTRGTSSAYDEFVELYNPTANTISVAGWQLQYLSAAGTSWSTRLIFPVGAQVLAGKYLLTANSAGYVSPGSGVVPDFWWGSTAGIADDGHIRLVDATGKEVDRIGYGSASFPEGGTPGSPNHGTSANSQSIGRKTDGTDTDVNRNDFNVRTSRNPKNSSAQVTSAKSDFEILSLANLSDVIPIFDTPEGIQIETSHPLLQQLQIELDLDATQLENVRQLVLAQSRRAQLLSEISKLEDVAERSEGRALSSEEETSRQNLLKAKKSELQEQEKEVQTKLQTLQESLGEKSYDWLEWVSEQRAIETLVLKAASSEDVEAVRSSLLSDPAMTELARRASQRKVLNVAREMEETEINSLLSQWKNFKQKSFEARFNLLTALHGLETQQSSEELLNNFKSEKLKLQP